MGVGVGLQQQGWGLSLGIFLALKCREADGLWLCPAGRS